MSKFISLILSAVLVLSGCSSASSKEALTEEITITEQEEAVSAESEERTPAEKMDTTVQNLTGQSFSGLDDPELLRYLEGNLYRDIVINLNTDKLFVENVEAVYISEEYIEELTWNSKENLYFGYSLSELDQQFEGQRYIFTLDEDRKTTVRELETFNSPDYSKAIENVVIGSGVILICVTVSAVSGVAGAPAVCSILSVSAKTASIMAASEAVMSGVASAIITGYQTKDMDEAMQAGIQSASEGFKLGAISGALIGGGTQLCGLYGSTLNGLSMNEAAKIQMESGYPLDIIKQFKSMDEYNLYHDAGLKAVQLGSDSLLIPDINLDYVSGTEGEQLTNLERMKQGSPAIDPETGKSYQLHHVNQNPEGTLAVLTADQHLKNPKILNIFGKESEIDRGDFAKVRPRVWKEIAAYFELMNA